MLTIDDLCMPRVVARLSHMSSIKEVKPNDFGRAAQDSWDSGMATFTPIFTVPVFKVGVSGRISDWPIMMAAVTDVGWVLHTWAVSSDAQGRPQALPLYVRP